jgi:hypothetical protein
LSRELGVLLEEEHARRLPAHALAVERHAQADT